jgi:cytosine/adenosine deaminase-related metal-dependent hydrolase
MLDAPAQRIRARFLVVDPETIINDGWLTLTESGVVRALGKVSDRDGGYFDLEIEGLVAAAMVNAHCHVEFGALAGRVPGGVGLHPWIAELMNQQRGLSPEARREGMERASAALATSGCGWVADINNAGGDSAIALAEQGLRGVVYHELLEPVAARAAHCLAAAGRAGETMPDGFELRLAPHTPFTCSRELLEGILRQPAAPVSLHLAEDPAEAEFLVDGRGPWPASLERLGRETSTPVPGKRSIPWLDELGLLGPQLLAVHLTDATPDELRLLARRGGRAVLCPRANLHIQGRLPPLEALLNTGLRPGLGTDSPAAHPSLDLRDDLALLAQRCGAIADGTLWAMATRWGAEALGLDAAAGSLWPGQAPGVVATDCASDEDPLHVLCREPDRPLRRLALPGPAPEGAP